MTACYDVFFTKLHSCDSVSSFFCRIERIVSVSICIRSYLPPAILSSGLTGATVLALANAVPESTPVPYPTPAPYIVSKTCDEFPEDTSESIRLACNEELRETDNGVLVINGNGEAYYAETVAGEKWLILVDGSQGEFETRDGVRLKNNQRIIGIQNNGTRPILKHAVPAQVIYILSADSYFERDIDYFEVRNLQLEESAIDSIANGPLLAGDGASGFVVENNVFNGFDEGLSYALVDLQPLRCYEGSLNRNDLKHWVQNNTFTVTSHHSAILIGPHCHGDTPGYITLTSNMYELGETAKGVNYVGGALLVRNEYFYFIENSHGLNGSYGIYVSHPALGHSRHKFDSEITGSTFDARGRNEYAIGVKLDTRESETYSLLISHNIFRGVKRAIEFSNAHDPNATATDVITTNSSICNVWEPGINSTNSSEPRCSGFPASGFIHFTDGLFPCGEMPEGFDPNCSMPFSEADSDSSTAASYSGSTITFMATMNTGVRISSLAPRPSGLAQKDENEINVLVGVNIASAVVVTVTLVVAVIAGVIICRVLRKSSGDRISRPHDNDRIFENPVYRQN